MPSPSPSNPVTAFNVTVVSVFALDVGAVIVLFALLTTTGVVAVVAPL